MTLLISLSTCPTQIYVSGIYTTGGVTNPFHLALRYKMIKTADRQRGTFTPLVLCTLPPIIEKMILKDKVFLDDCYSALTRYWTDSNHLCIHMNHLGQEGNIGNSGIIL